MATQSDVEIYTVIKHNPHNLVISQNILVGLALGVSAGIIIFTFIHLEFSLAFENQPIDQNIFMMLLKLSI